MRLISCHINNFGKLHDLTMDFDPKLCVINEENGWYIMKIIYTSDAIIPNRPAHTVHIMKMCSAFTENGHEVTLLVHKGGREFGEGYVNPIKCTDIRRTFIRSVSGAGFRSTPWEKGSGHRLSL